MAIADLVEITRTEEIPGLSHPETMRLAQSQMSALENELRRLSPEDWDAPTDCERWSVKDIVAHVTGWAEVLASPKAFLRQAKLTRSLRKELDDKLDAQNEAQVVARRNMTPDELIEAWSAAAPKFLSLRRGLGLVGKPIPLYNGAIGWTTVRFLLGQIFMRDHFMHRIDISRATGKEMTLGQPERRIVADVVRHWARNSKPNVRLELSGAAGGVFVSGSGEGATIKGDALDFCRLMCGRASVSDFEIEGDEGAGRAWLAVRVPF
ncbi:MAG TPA: maleylpyruvate isomerase family mycothiol-dependent enzyme [Actinomycetota bacterium]|nr:maleylpyruvate isomerase family mycothiol-dependent enzyme [Actinomycetota bacterium]